MPENPEAREQDVKDAPYLRVTTGVLTLKADRMTSLNKNILPRCAQNPALCSGNGKF